MDERKYILIDKARDRMLAFTQSKSHTYANFTQVRNFVLAAIENVFGEDSSEFDRVSEAFGKDYYCENTSDIGVANSARRMNVELAYAEVDSIKEIHQEIYDLNPELVRGAQRVMEGSRSKVFLVHGHDELVRESVASFLRKIGLEVIILQEEAAGGATIIEKIERYSDVGFAVVLFTPDDVGGRSGGATAPRPRQNVVFEAGYFFGLITRSRVVVLYDESIETISDLAGLNYIKLDGSSGWKLGLVRELRAANMEFDETRI